MGTDASDFAIGACLIQKHDGKMHIIIYYSKKISLAELNYNIHNKKLFTIVSAFDHWRIYIANAI